MRSALRFLSILFILLQTPVWGYSQSSKEVVMLHGKKYYLHEVQKGETVTSICKAYNVKRDDLMTSNTELLYGMKFGETIKIPVPEAGNQKPEKKKKKVRKDRKKSKRKTISQDLDPTEDFVFHTVEKGETAYSLARKYSIPVQEIFKLNPEAKAGILKGEVLRIPHEISGTEIAIAEPVVEDGFVTHIVSPGETLYSISRKYDLPVNEILSANPHAANVLSVGSKLKIEKTIEKEVEISDSDYFYHRIEKGETFFRLEREYGVTSEKLKALNPALEEGLKSGLSIKIPKEKIPEEKVAPVDEEKFIYYEVKRGDNMYAISSTYNIKIRDLKEINPVLKRRGLVPGDKLLIPKKVVVTETIPVDQPTKKITTPIKIQKIVKVEAPEPELPEECKNYNYNDTPDTFQVALFLPLYLPANDTINRIRLVPNEDELKEWTKIHANDTLQFPVQFETREDKIVYPRSVNFLNFYEGFLLAVDSLKKTGLEVELFVYDTNRDQSVIDSLVQRPEFLSLDLIVGPIYGDNQTNVAKLAYKNRIPMISPLAENAELLKKNPYYFQIRPDKQCRIKNTADFIGDEFYDANFIVLTNGNWKHLDEAKLVDLCREKLFSTGFYDQAYEPLFRQIDLKKDGFFGLEHVMDPLRENVIIVPTSNEAQVSVAISNLNSLSERFKISLVGMNEYTNFKSISSENLHHLNMYFLSPYHVDYTDLKVNEFIGTYREHFYNEPNRFSFQGYDVAFYFLSGMKQYGKRFAECLPFIKVDLLQAEYNFQRSTQFGGFMNTSLNILNYDRYYNVRCDGKIGNTPVYFIDGIANDESQTDSIQTPQSPLEENINNHNNF